MPLPTLSNLLAPSMVPRGQLFIPTVVRKLAAGTGNYPDTYLLFECLTFPIKKGISLHLYTLEDTIFTHLGWVMVEEARVVGRREVEFVLRRLDNGDDELVGNHHFLVVERRMASLGFSLQTVGATVMSWARKLVKRNAPASPQASISPPRIPAAPPNSPHTSLDLDSYYRSSTLCHSEHLSVEELSPPSYEAQNRDEHVPAV